MGVRKRLGKIRERIQQSSWGGQESNRLMITRYCGTAHLTVIDGNEAGDDLVSIKLFLLSCVNYVAFVLTSIFKALSP